MLTRDGDVKIGGFGIAQHALSDETQVMGLLGSPRYKSPEQVCEEELTHQSDILLQVDSRLLEYASSGCQLRCSHVFVQTLIERLARSNERLAEALAN